MKNFVQAGKNITVPSPGNITGGSVVVIGSIVGVAAGDASTAQPLDIVAEGVFDLPKVEAMAITIGAPVFIAGGLITTADGGGANPYVGIAVTEAANPSASVHVKIGTAQVTIIND